VGIAGMAVLATGLSAGEDAMHVFGKQTGS
jgi:hypothetical protein